MEQQLSINVRPQVTQLSTVQANRTSMPGSQPLSAINPIIEGRACLVRQPPPAHSRKTSASYEMYNGQRLEESSRRDRKPIDITSMKGMFGWATIDSVNIPYLLRESTKFVSVRMVEQKLLSKYHGSYPEEMKARAPLTSQYITEHEAKLLNEINLHHCDGEFGRSAFTVDDLVVDVVDLEEFYGQVKMFFTKTKAAFIQEGGWVQINNTVVPYVKRPSRLRTKLVPLSVIRYGAGLLKDEEFRGLDPTEEECDYLTARCHAMGLKVDFNVDKTRFMELHLLPVLTKTDVSIKDLPDDDPFGHAQYNEEASNSLSQSSLDYPAKDSATNGTLIHHQGRLSEHHQPSGVHEAAHEGRTAGCYPPATWAPPHPTAAGPLEATHEGRTAGCYTPVTWIPPHPTAAGPIEAAHEGRTAGCYTPVTWIPPHPTAAGPLQLTASSIQSPQVTVWPSPHLHSQRTDNAILMDQTRKRVATAQDLTYGSWQHNAHQTLVRHPLPSVISDGASLLTSGEICWQSRKRVTSPQETAHPKVSKAQTSIRASHSTCTVNYVNIFGKSMLCLCREPGKRWVAPVGAICRIFFAGCPLDEFRHGLENILGVSLKEFTREEEEAYLAVHGQPIHMSDCCKVLDLNEFARYWGRLQFLFGGTAKAVHSLEAHKDVGRRAEALEDAPGSNTTKEQGPSVRHLAELQVCTGTSGSTLNGGQHTTLSSAKHQERPGAQKRPAQDGNTSHQPPGGKQSRAGGSKLEAALNRIKHFPTHN